jgi:hypothetical protein
MYDNLRQAEKRGGAKPVKNRPSVCILCVDIPIFYTSCHVTVI